MDLRTQIKEDMKDAMRSKNSIAVTTLRGLMSAFTNELVAQKKKPTDNLSEDDVIKVIKRAVKQRKDSIEQFERGGRTDLAEKEKEELLILEKYLPEQVSAEDVEKAVRAKIEEFGISDKSKIGQLIGAVMKDFSGNVDGSLVKQIAERILA